MKNPLFNALGNVPMFGNMQNFMTQFQQFKQTFSGDPQQTINQMLQNGQINQQQIEQAKQMAEQFRNMMR